MTKFFEKIVVALLVSISFIITFKIYQSYLLFEKKKILNKKLEKKYFLSKELQNKMISKLYENDA